MAELIRKYLLLLILISSISLRANEKISLYCNMGQAIPLLSYNAASKTDNIIQIAQTTDFGKSFSFGIDMDLENNLGLSLGILFREFSMDRDELESLHHSVNLEISSYVSALRMHDNLSLVAGVYKEYGWGKFTLYPELSLGISNINSDFAEIYYFNDNSELIHTKSYEFKFRNSAVLGLGSDIDYQITSGIFFDIKLNLRFQFNLQAPKITADIVETDFSSNSIERYKENYQETICSAFWGVGLVINFL